MKIENVVRWMGAVKYVEYEEVMSKMEEHLEKGNLPITLIINSEGGFVPIAYSFVKEVGMRRIPLNTMIIGRADSVAVPIALTGKVRAIEEESHIYLHELMFSKNEDKEKKENMKEWYVKTLACKTKLRPEEIRKMMNSNTLLNAKQAVNYGFAHKIL